MTNIRWSPTPNPAGITQAWVTIRLLVAQIPSIGLLPQKKVGPIFLPVYSPTTSCMFSPLRFVRERLIDFLYISSFTSMHTIRRYPSSPHLVSCSNKLSWKCIRGHIRSLLVVTKNLLCCWYDVSLFSLLFPQGLYPHMIQVYTPLPWSVITDHLPKPVGSFPLSFGSTCCVRFPKRRRRVPPCWILPTFSCTLCAAIDWIRASPPLNSWLNPLTFLLCLKFILCLQ
jgi:hypothetical protein